MQGERCANATATVLRTFPDGRVFIEIRKDLAIGEMVRYNPAKEKTPHLLPPDHPAQVICLLESEDGNRIYRATRGERVIFRPAVPLCPGDWLEKLSVEGCLRIEAVIRPEDICFLNGVVEGHADMAVLRTLDSSVGLVELLASPFYEEEIRQLLFSLQKKMPLEIKAIVHDVTSIFL
ncbi:MAG: DUF4911 domain-containing protein [bacterium]